jgi:hypothetical protein
MVGINPTNVKMPRNHDIICHIKISLYVKKWADSRGHPRDFPELFPHRQKPINTKALAQRQEEAEERTTP